jgi:(1->4)-alpha-D-glucan 1-alpha-D-glucosylmutase
MRIPIATYRFQFNKGFTFAQARELLPYLRDLGISDVYASPIFLAGPESTHGYDICAFDRINPNLGTPEDFDAFTAEIRKLDMGLLVDMVPNHMGSHSNNCWWIDVLKHGPTSKFARYFDINWNSANPLLKNKVLLPILGDHYGAVLERGELKVTFANGEYHLAYFDKQFPLSPESIAAFNLNQLTDLDLEPFLAKLNGTPGNAASFDDLDKLIELQHYRLAYWRVGPHEINYRRFFDVTELVSVRVEDEEVFLATHKFLFELLRSGKITGLRIDHPDGLRDPKTYFERLQKHAGGDQYILAEKILSDDERLPIDWPIQGTTGYDYLIYQNSLFIDREQEAAFTQIYSRFTGSSEDFPSLAFRSKQEVLNRMFVAEVNALISRLKALAISGRTSRDFTEAELRSAIINFIAGFPVYRTYVTESTQQLSSAETDNIQHGLAEAKKHTPSTEHPALDFLADILSLHFPADMPDQLQKDAREFVIRFQQLSGPATAKGLEDTAFYRYTRFVSLNEVGGNPARFGVIPAEFHAYNEYKLQESPCSMLSTSTHDTKRGEDTRARLNVLSEMPADWENAVFEWRELNEKFNKDPSPAPADEYLLYQVLVGTWTPDSHLDSYIDRIQNYMLKATREAKTHTSWTESSESYESALKHFTTAILSNSEFRSSLSAFSEKVAYFGMFNSLAQVILKTCCPGVSDFYQGTEHWDLTLVDPDNRRPIDYTLRQNLLAKLRTQQPRELLKDWRTGAIKTFTVANCLRFRHDEAALVNGDYRPLTITGTKSNHIVAFARTSGASTVIVVVPRFIRTLTGGSQTFPTPAQWDDTRVEYPGTHFHNMLTNEKIPSLAAADLFQSFPGAILKPL